MGVEIQNLNEAKGGPWTSHGHDVPGITVAGSGRPDVARCGGINICKTCRDEAIEMQMNRG